MRVRSTLSLLSLAALAGGGACGDDNKLPDNLVSRTTTLVQYQSCSDLETDLEDMMIYEAWANIDRWGNYGWAEDDAGAPTGGDFSDGDGRTEGEDFSGTNNQESGVDEADLVKTDGYHVYALNGSRLHIYGVPEFGQLTPESVTQIEGNPREMLLDKDAKRAVVFSQIYAYSLPEGHPLRELTGVDSGDDYGWYWRAGELTKITVLDITDHTAPQLVREVYYEGWYTTARKVESSVRMATYGIISNSAIDGWWRYLNEGHSRSWTKQRVASDIRALDIDDFVPRMFLRTPDGNFTTMGMTNSQCRSFYRPTDSHARGIASLISFDLLGSSFAFDSDSIVANWPTFYASKDKIVLAENAHDWWWFYEYQGDPDQLNVHVFDTTQPGKSNYIGSGRVDGWLTDQFAIDEEDGVIRMASTTGFGWRWWEDGEERPQLENHVWTLRPEGGTVPTIGHIGGIAPNESIRSVRFLGDKGYVVTFENIDPLFTIDLADPEDPKVVGELKVPGFSTYLHPMGDSRLLAIGVGGDENGANWQTVVSTFDVGDFANPTQTASLPLSSGDGWSWSEAQYEHKAFQYWAPKKLLAIPSSNYESSFDQFGNYHYRYLSRLDVINVDDATGALSLKGSIDHTAYYTTDNYWYWREIRRSIFMGDYIYAISDKAITVHRTSDLGLVTTQLLPGWTQDDIYWWW